jgi:hypothetical protein
MTQPRFVRFAAFAVVLACTSVAAAEMPMPTTSTPTLYGAQVLPKGTSVLGLTTGYPQTTFDMYWGLPSVDLGLHVGLTYGGRLSGLAQRFGMITQVPLRWTLKEGGKFALGLRFSPFLMLGESGPSFSLGGDLGVLFDIPLPKIFKLIVGPELRTAFATPGGDPSYLGGFWVNIGIETFISREFFVGLQFRGGGSWLARGDRNGPGPGNGFGNGNRGGFGGGGLFNALIYGGMTF